MRHLEVGKLFEPGRTQYEEGVKFEYTPSGPLLLLFFNCPTPKEIASVRSGKFKFGFYEHANIIFTLSKFEGMKWIDAPYSIHLSPPFEFAPELETDPSVGIALQIFVVDATTGILHVMRYVGLGHDFSLRFRDAILKQQAVEFNKDAYRFNITDAYRRYTTDQMVDYAQHFYTLK